MNLVVFAHEQKPLSELFEYNREINLIDKIFGELNKFNEVAKREAAFGTNKGRNPIDERPHVIR